MPLKHSFNFRLEGVPLREASLFTSYVRVLAFRLHHKWHHQESAAHLIIYGDVSLEQNARQDPASPVQTLVLSASDHNPINFLRLPLDSAEIEVALNRIGAMLIQSPAHQKIAIPNTTKRYRLLRWPPSALLHSRDRMRLATIMTRQAISIDELHKRAGLGLDLCRLFIEDMLKKGLLEVSATEEQKQKQPQGAGTPQKAEKITTQSRIFSLIRSNLSRFTTSGG